MLHWGVCEFIPGTHHHSSLTRIYHLVPLMLQHSLSMQRPASRSWRQCLDFHARTRNRAPRLLSVTTLYIPSTTHLTCFTLYPFPYSVTNASSLYGPIHPLTLSPHAPSLSASSQHWSCVRWPVAVAHPSLLV